ncbi:YidC/Oxa1 family membrane protein insertase [Acetivibrio mesophilus]|uniref:YidC/Oxa1 family membrane protein insertase n=1 Tax=Acetivibrio mesophilus TaxID=2487273 RepID=A0A4Q0I2E6_9FIRM|nr:YidC/Oxa1 family membrane protein insertase [Acetivibrio mesophilus]ODM27142.1 preprotein translocase YidC [Clostridium sp. Bc-iso-3]RXE57825.1 YidC/Oxa1 family membrane protein insertase [Acetivibrio mesophilus]HHV28526.1 YidC/Oxa1 family membrane protein insertase [Clostridium sp.]
MGIISQFLGQILVFIYENLTFGSYGLAIILFTIFVKLLLLPLTIKQYKSSAKMQEIQPLIQEVQRKYKNDPELQSQEMMKIYKEHNFSPTSGCLPTLIQLPIMFSLYYVIREPLTYMFNMTKEQIETLVNQLNQATNGLPQINMKNIYFQIEAALRSGKLDVVENLGFIKFDLGKIPKLNFTEDVATYLPLLLIPILAVVSTYISSKMIMVRTQNSKNSKNSKNQKQDDMSTSMNKSMLFVGPIMTGIISFQAPAALGLYWLTSNVFQIIQQYLINKLIMKKKEDSDS